MNANDSPAVLALFPIAAVVGLVIAAGAANGKDLPDPYPQGPSIPARSPSAAPHPATIEERIAAVEKRVEALEKAKPKPVRAYVPPKPLAELKADDFIAGMKRCCPNHGWDRTPSTDRDFALWLPKVEKHPIELRVRFRSISAGTDDSKCFETAYADGRQCSCYLPRGSEWGELLSMPRNESLIVAGTINTVWPDGLMILSDSKWKRAK